MPGKSRVGKGSASKSNGREERKTEVFERTKMCKFHILGICLRGTECKYAHHVSELQMPPDLYRTKMCTTMISQGSCTDPECCYAHSKEELRSMPTSTKKIESCDAQSGLSDASTTADNETWKDPMKIELPMDMLSYRSTSMSQSGSLPLWDSSAEESITSVRDGLSETSFKTPRPSGESWQMEQAGEEDGSGLGDHSLWLNSLFEAEEKDTKSDDSFLYNALFQGEGKMLGDMPYRPPGFESMPFMLEYFGTHGYNGMSPFMSGGGGYNSGMTWGWDSFSGLDMSSTVSEPEEIFDMSGIQRTWHSPSILSKFMHDKSEPARVPVTHTKI